MECYSHKKIAVTNCRKCQVALCEECASRFKETLCYSCAEMKRREMVAKNQKLKTFLLWSVPLGMILGLILHMMILPGEVDDCIIGTICGATFPVVLRRVYYIFIYQFAVVLDLILSFRIIIGLVLLFITFIVLLYAYYFSWIVFFGEIIAFAVRRNKILTLSENL